MTDDHWTEFDPGKGDLAVCTTAKAWIDDQVEQLVSASEKLTTMLTTLEDSWSGQSADGFRERATSLKTAMTDSVETLQAAGTAINTYNDEVADIATKAEAFLTLLDGARSILNGAYDDILGLSPTAPATQQEWQDTQNTAIANVKSATDGLAELAGRRWEADSALTNALARLSSAAWGDLDCSAPTETGPQRDLANDRVFDLLEAFRTGKGPRGFVLGPDDPFVTTLMQSEHIWGVRAQVLEDLRSGNLDLYRSDDGVQFPRIISNNIFVLGNDINNVERLIWRGPIADLLLRRDNLPESFLGSYSLGVYAGEPAADGGVTVTYVINNDTTIDSATRIPGTGGLHVPLYDAMVDANRNDGSWQDHHQTITWTETIYP